MATRLPDGDFRTASVSESDGHERPAEADGTDALPIAEDPLTGLPWTETLLPLVTSWAVGSAVQAICLHFVGFGTLASLPEFQSSHSLLREAAERVGPVMGDDDRLTRFSGNKLLVFSKRPERATRTLLVDMVDRLESFGAEVEGRHLPEIRVGVARLEGSRQPVTRERVISLLSEAAEDTIPLADVVTPGRPRPEEPLEPALPVHRISAVQVEVVAPASEESVEQDSVRDEGETPMISRGYHERTAIRSVPGAPGPATAPEASGGPEDRLVLRAVDIVVTGLVATATVDLDFDGRRVRGKAIGRSSDGHPIALVGEAMTRAVTDLLPAGHGAVFRQAVSTATDAGEAIVTVVDFLTPERTEILFGIAPSESEQEAGVARSILNAVNRRASRLLEAAG